MFVYKNLLCFLYVVSHSSNEYCGIHTRTPHAISRTVGKRTERKTEHGKTEWMVIAFANTEQSHRASRSRHITQSFCTQKLNSYQ